MDMPLVERGVGAQAIEVAVAINIVDPYPFSTGKDHIQGMVVMSPILLFQFNIFLSIHKTSCDTFHNMAGFYPTLASLKKGLTRTMLTVSALKPILSMCKQPTH